MASSIVDFASLTAVQIDQATRILREALAHLPSAYGAPGAAEDEVARLRTDGDWLGFAAREGERVAGWIGALRTYSHGWEIHPLAVDPGAQRRGVGTRLMARLETAARAAGVLTLFLGSDDDYRGTTLFGRDLFPGVLGQAGPVEATDARHPLGFYRRCGFEPVGVLPDVNGRGKPDLLLAKSLRSASRG
jgi:aminoglycoside 6'-N-acetyltransferase I